MGVRGFFSFGRPISEYLVFQTLVTVELIITGQEFELKFLLGCKELTPNILVSMVNILNSNPILVRTEQVIAKFCFARSNKKKTKNPPTFSYSRQRKKSNKVQLPSRWAMLIFHPKPTQPVVWCGIAHKELSTNVQVTEKTRPRKAGEQSPNLPLLARKPFH